MRGDVFPRPNDLFRAQGGHGIEPAGPAGGKEAGEECGRAEEDSRACEEEGTVRRDLIEL